MRWKSHVRFGGRAGETHQPKGWQGAPVRPLHVWTLAGFVYVSFCVDVFSRMILGWTVSGSKSTRLVSTVVQQALKALHDLR